jgi:hypothetical protein
MSHSTPSSIVDELLADLVTHVLRTLLSPADIMSKPVRSTAVGSTALASILASVSASASRCDTRGRRSKRPQRRRHDIVEEKHTAARARVSGMPPIKERERIHDHVKAGELEQTVQQNKALPPQSERHDPEKPSPEFSVSVRQILSSPSHVAPAPIMAVSSVGYAGNAQTNDPRVI